MTFLREVGRERDGGSPAKRSWDMAHGSRLGARTVGGTSYYRRTNVRPRQLLRVKLLRCTDAAVSHAMGGDGAVRRWRASGSRLQVG